jgi:hypothetical protein
MPVSLSRVSFAALAFATLCGSTAAESIQCNSDGETYAAVQAAGRQMAEGGALQRDAWNSYIKALDAKALDKSWDSKRRNEVMLAVLDTPAFRKSQQDIRSYEIQILNWVNTLKSVEAGIESIRAACELTQSVVPALKAMLDIRLAQYRLALAALLEEE